MASVGIPGKAGAGFGQGMEMETTAPRELHARKAQLLALKIRLLPLGSRGDLTQIPPSERLKDRGM
jgi:hypothetical protein